jgi:prevent-host-death family protein
MRVGIRELRDSLSRHLAEVRVGATVTITDHGTPVARIVPVDAPTRLEQRIAEGRVAPARRRKLPARTASRVAGTVRDLIVDQGR